MPPWEAGVTGVAHGDDGEQLEGKGLPPARRVPSTAGEAGRGEGACGARGERQRADAGGGSRAALPAADGLSASAVAASVDWRINPARLRKLSGMSPLNCSPGRMTGLSVRSP